MRYHPFDTEARDACVIQECDGSAKPMNECRVSSCSSVRELDVKTTPNVLKCMTQNIRQNAFLTSLLLCPFLTKIVARAEICDVTKFLHAQFNRNTRDVHVMSFEWSRDCGNDVIENGDVKWEGCCVPRSVQ